VSFPLNFRPCALAVLSPNLARFRKDSCRSAGVAQISNLPYRRIVFGRAPVLPKSSASAAASGLQIRDTAEWNSALLWMPLCAFALKPCKPMVSLSVFICVHPPCLRPPAVLALVAAGRGRSVIELRFSG
jgi:hypothetical protein